MSSKLRQIGASVALPLAVFFAVTIEMAPVGAISHISNDLDIRLDQVALGSTTYALATAITAIPIALMLQKMALRGAVIASGVALAISASMAAAAVDLYGYLLWRTISGVAHGALFPMILALAARSSRRPERSISHVLVGNAGALALGVPLVELVSSHSWRAPVLAAAFGVVLSISMAPSPRAERSKAGNDNSGTFGFWKLVTLSFIFALALTGHFSFYTFLAPLADEAGFPSASVLAAYGLTVVAASITAGWVSSRRRILRAAVVVATEGAVIACMAGIRDPLAVVTAALVAGACFGLLPALVQSEMLASANTREGLVSALAVVAFNAGIASGAWLGGHALLEGSQFPALLGSALLAVSAIAFLLHFTAFRTQSPAEPRDVLAKSLRRSQG